MLLGGREEARAARRWKYSSEVMLGVTALALVGDHGVDLLRD